MTVSGLSRKRSHGKIAAETAASIRTSRHLTLNFKPLLKDEPFSSSLKPSIAKYIGHLPRQSLLKYAQTEDQKAYWGHLAAFYFVVSHRCHSKS
ncbi:hypothetical protein [Coleofasciculus sp. FACHB-129]|uniref:hypothetical protein n=1 Tax=Cyanophyceae TaxID=3028117 RepID=UPI0016870C66|nr:hypothetical protein [Coleofasciculus sp. FACHB-129]